MVPSLFFTNPTNLGAVLMGAMGEGEELSISFLEKA